MKRRPISKEDMDALTARVETLEALTRKHTRILVAYTAVLLAGTCAAIILI